MQNHTSLKFQQLMEIIWIHVYILTNLFCRISTYFERKTIKDKLQIKHLVQLKDYDFENFDDKGEKQGF